MIFTFLGARGGFELNRFPNHRILPYALVMPSIAVIAIFLIIPLGGGLLVFPSGFAFGALRNRLAKLCRDVCFRRVPVQF